MDVSKVGSAVVREKLKSYVKVNNIIKRDYDNILENTKLRYAENPTWANNEEEEIKKYSTDETKLLKAVDTVAQLLGTADEHHRRMGVITKALGGCNPGVLMDFDAWMSHITTTTDKKEFNKTINYVRLNPRPSLVTDAKYTESVDNGMKFLRKPRVTLGVIGKT